MEEHDRLHPSGVSGRDRLARPASDDPKVVVLDCTTHLIPNPKITYQVKPGREDFEKGHIPGAQFVDICAMCPTRRRACGSCGKRRKSSPPRCVGSA